MRRGLLASGIVLFLALVAVAQDVVGKPARTFSAADVLGRPRVADPLLSLRGRTVLLVFFGTRYEKCIPAAAHVNKLNDALGPRGLSPLWVAEEERAAVEPWIAKTGVDAMVALVDTRTRDEMNRDYPVPGYPTAFLIDPDGTIVWTGHPQALKEPAIVPYLENVRVPPVLPAEFAAEQAMLDRGEWAAARTALLAKAAAGSLDKRLAVWANGTAGWIEKRRPKVLDDAAALAAKEWWWDSWEVYDDFTRRFAGMEGADAAAAKAAEIRANPAARADLEIGDDIVKAKGHLERKKPDAARLILERISKLTKTRFAERAKKLLAEMKKPG